MPYRYTLTVTDEETEEEIIEISGLSKESLLEKLGRVDAAIGKYETPDEFEEEEEMDNPDQRPVVSEGEL